MQSYQPQIIEDEYDELSESYINGIPKHVRQNFTQSDDPLLESSVYGIPKHEYFGGANRYERYNQQFSNSSNNTNSLEQSTLTGYINPTNRDQRYYSSNNDNSLQQTTLQR